ncbi:uncharacterized protein gjz1 [Stegostoma tigrinum]|uniref:uncharacterized protein gjz1 n=1 Tax=Stegostoma tigrinum TaxID=3053191 RepID=UPI00202B8844|nr:uncharacterized protein gjz1 [Stegostoma tigrinum]
MAAAYVAALGRLASVAMSCVSGAQGLTLWSGLIGLRLLALFIADRTWSGSRTHFVCNSTAASSSVTEFCTTSCFNLHFQFPVDIFWHFSFLLALLPIICLYMLAPRRRPGLPEAGPLPQEEKERGRLSLEEPRGRAQGRGRPWLSIGCSLSLVALESAFVWVVLKIQLPLVLPPSISCLMAPGSACNEASGGPLTCILVDRANKLGALSVMAFTSLLNVGVSLGYVVTVCLAPRGSRWA